MSHQSLQKISLFESGDEEKRDMLGSRIRALRKQEKMTLNDLSASSGLSRAALSKIERGEMSPTYDSLTKVAKGLKIGLASLLSGKQTSSFQSFSITRAGDGATYNTERFRHRLLAHEYDGKAMTVFITEITARRVLDNSDFDNHQSEDLLFVLSGNVRVFLKEFEPVDLGEGDSLYLDGRIYHALITLPPPHKAEEAEAEFENARILWVSVSRE